MSVSKDQARMITALAIACRPIGAPRWDDEGTYRAIAKVQHWPIAMAIENVIRHAADPKAQTPGVIGSKHTPPELGVPNPGPPRTEETCPAHPAQRAESCPWCVHRVKAWDEDAPSTPDAGRRATPEQTAAALAACRDAIHEAKEA